MEVISFENITTILILIYSIILHEVAHGYIAYRFGDKTAFYADRLTLNPLKHIDIYGSILIPVITVWFGLGLFGWAKPVPVNPFNFKSKYAFFCVSAAGIIVNFFLALVSYGILFLILKGFIPFEDKSALLLSTFIQVFFTIISVNLSLALFNLIPIPPFDGMKILQSLFKNLRDKALFFENNILFMVVSIYLASKAFSLFFPTLLNIVIHSLEY